MKKFLLSTGRSSYRVEYFILDLFKIYLTVYPEDIPGADGIGFDFSLAGVKKEDLKNELTLRLASLISKFKNKFGDTVSIELSSIELIDETLANVSINVNSMSDDITIDLNNYGL